MTITHSLLVLNDVLVKNGYPSILNLNMRWDDYSQSMGGVSEEFCNIIFPLIESLKLPGFYLNVLNEMDKPPDRSIIIEIFTQSDLNNKWRLCDIIERKKWMFGLEDWIVSTFMDKTYCKEVSLLALCIARFANKHEAIKILKENFDLHPAMAAFALRKIKTFKDIQFMEVKENKYSSGELQCRYNPKDLVLMEIRKTLKKFYP